MLCGGLCALLALTPTTQPAVAGNSEAPMEYTIDIDLKPVTRRLAGVNQFRWVNRTEAPVKSFPLILYPNRFATYDPEQMDDLFERIFPRRVSLGGMRLKSVTADGRACSIAAHADSPFETGVVVEVSLPDPLPAGAHADISIEFEVTIPERYGPFGAHQGALCLNGGWYPYLPAQNGDEWNLHAPPPESLFDLTIHTEEGHLFINHLHHETAQNGRTFTGTCRANYLTLLYYPEIHIQSHDSSHGEIRYITRRPRSRTAQRLFTAVEQSLKQLHDTAPTLPHSDIRVFEVPLRRDLVIPGAGVLLLSDRYDRVFFAARDYHNAPLIEAVYHLRIDPHLPHSAEQDFPWESEAVAWLEANRFWHEYRQRAESARHYLHPFRFIPEVDRLLNAPRFPFVRAFYGDFYDRDPLREDILRFNRRNAHGRIIAEKLRDLLGDSAILESSAVALRDKTALLPLAEAQYGESLDTFVAQWTKPYPSLNYELAEWRQQREADGSWLSEVTIRRTGQQVREPVTVKASRRFGDAFRETWAGDDREGTVQIATPKKAHRVQIDPDRRLLETTRADNRLPPGWKVLLDNVRLHIDLNRHQHEISAAGSLIRGNDYRNRYRFFLFADQEYNGIELRHIHSFGRQYDMMTYRQDLTWGLLYVDLDEDFADPASGRTNESGRAAALKLGYTIRTTESGRNRLSGWTLGFDGEAGHEEVASDFGYWKSRVRMSGVVPLSRDRHLLGLRGHVGVADRDGTPPQLLFDLGGFGAIRGINRGLLLGSRIWQASAEYRHILLNDLDLHAATWLWLRRVQLAAYVDAGNVSDRERDLFRGNDVHWGVGAGIRLHVDLFGAFPGVWRFDVARQLDRDAPKDDRPLMYYIGIGQSF